MLLLKVEDIIRFATENGLDRWDWIAITITSATFIISCISLIIASKTLISQKKTEKNTKPDIDLGIQLWLVEDYLLRLFQSVFDLYALFYTLVKTDFKTKPSHRFWYNFIKPNDYFFERVFYFNQELFTEFKELSNLCVNINQGVEKLKFLFEEDASEGEIRNEFSFIFYDVSSVPYSIMALMKYAFNQTKAHTINTLLMFYDPNRVISEKVKQIIIDNSFEQNDILKNESANYTPQNRIEKDIFEVLEKDENFDFVVSMMSDSLSNYDDIDFGNIEGYIRQGLKISIVQYIKSMCLDHILYRGQPFLSFINPGYANKRGMSSSFSYLLLDKNIKE